MSALCAILLVLLLVGALYVCAVPGVEAGLILREAKGEPTGTAAADNARVILEQAERVSKFR